MGLETIQYGKKKCLIMDAYILSGCVPLGAQWKRIVVHVNLHSKDSHEKSY